MQMDFWKKLISLFVFEALKIEGKWKLNCTSSVVVAGIAPGVEAENFEKNRKISMKKASRGAQF